MAFRLEFSPGHHARVIKAPKLINSPRWTRWHYARRIVHCETTNAPDFVAAGSLTRNYARCILTCARARDTRYAARYTSFSPFILPLSFFMFALSLSGLFPIISHPDRQSRVQMQIRFSIMARRVSPVQIYACLICLVVTADQDESRKQETIDHCGVIAVACV